MKRSWKARVADFLRSPGAGYIAVVGVVLLMMAPLELMAFFHPPDGKERAEWMQFLGRFHTIIVHLPITLVLLVPLLELAGRGQRWQFLRPAAWFVLGLAALASLTAVILGGLLAYSGDYEGTLVQSHMWSGVGVSIVCGLALCLRAWMERRRTRGSSISYAVSLILAAGLVGWTGLQGNSLTRGEGYLTQQMPPRLKTILGVETRQARISSGQPADAFYGTHIQPIFDQQCIVCHGARKKKGGLILESYADLAQGGDGGPVVQAGNPEASEVFRRVNLPGDHEEVMPSDGKPPLEKAEILLIKQWIMTGASPKTTLADLAAAGIELPARPGPTVPVAPDYRQFTAQIKALESKLPLRLIPVSQNVTDGLVLRTAAEVDKVDDSVVAQLAPIAPLIVDAELSRTRITNKSLAAVAKFTNLRRLDLAYTAVTSDGLGTLAPLSHLRTINLVATVVDDSAASALRRLNGLREVHAFESKMSEGMLRILRTALEERSKAPTRSGAREKATGAPSQAESPAMSPVVTLTSKDAVPNEPTPKAGPPQEAGGTDNEVKAP